MNKTNRRLVIVMYALLAFGTFGTRILLAAETADTIITNARVYTVNPQQKWAEAIAVRADKIIFVGDAKSAESYKGPSTKVIDAKGKLVLPGFTDCHVHFMEDNPRHRWSAEYASSVRAPNPASAGLSAL